MSLEAIDWILGCVSSVNFVFLINGKPSSFFKSTRGLRQGCPLSALLFLLIIEGLSRGIQEWVKEKNIEVILVARELYITHLMFVDDVILFGNGNLDEWEVFKDVLELFCQATGMIFITQKLLFLEVGWEENEMDLIKAILPYDIKPVEEGFKYLGLFLKPNYYSRLDWIWLEKKIDKRILSWSHKWLSLGGRVILVKFVLESIYVYWLSMEKIPKSVLNSIRKRIFSFLWSGKKFIEGMHLASWKKLAKPKKSDGWGLKNIFSFGKALATKSLWQCIMMPGVWHKVMIKKYIKNKSVEEWFRQGRITWTGTSNFCRALIASLSIITDWLVWNPWNGRAIRIGTDPMVGSHTYYKLSRNLILKLKAQGIEFLAQARTSEVEDMTYTRWKKDESLGLERDQKEEWNNFC
jgi:hypothetical protein